MSLVVVPIELTASVAAAVSAEVSVAAMVPASDEFLDASSGHGLILGELVCPLCKTSISGAPRAPDGGFTPTTAAKVGATSMVWISL